MNSLLKNIAFALLVVILLMGLAAGKAEAQPSIEITPQQFNISGIIGTNSFEYPFTVRALNENITELTFSPSNLMEISRGKTWISGTNVQIRPDVSRINKGQSKDFVVTVQNIPWSGQYDGAIAVSYKEQAADARDTLSISVRAANFSAIPHKISLKFEKSLLGHGNTSEVPWTLELKEESRRASQEMMDNLSKSASVSLDPLVHSEDESQVIRPEQILVQLPNIERMSAGQGLMINTNFTNPQVAAGRYTGTMEVRSEEFGLLVSVPVEVQVRYPSWLAWLLIFAGIIISIPINWWNTTGKKKNAIWQDVYELEDDLSSATTIEEDCRKKIMALLVDVRKSLRRNKLEEARQKVNQATTCLENKCEKQTGKRGKDGENGLIIHRWKQWWTPKRQWWAVNILLWIVAIPLLVVIGFSQLYANNFTFGATNVWQEYLTLFLWGFGIQMGTATAASVLTTIRGS